MKRGPSFSLQLEAVGISTADRVSCYRDKTANEKEVVARSVFFSSFVSKCPVSLDELANSPPDLHVKEPGGWFNG